MTIKSDRGFWKGRARSFGFAWKGIKTLFGSEANAKVHLCVAALVIAASFIFGLSGMEWCVVLHCIGAVFMAEGFNTALEAVADKVSPEFHPLIGKAKDVAAGAVLLLVVAVVVVGLIVFIPHIIQLFK